MIEREINGVTRKFKFGTYTLKIIGQDTGEKVLNKVFDRLISGDYPFILSFCWACAKHASIELGESPVPSEMEVSNWMDDLGVDQTDKLLAELIDAYKAKNLTAPQETGQMIAQ